MQTKKTVISIYCHYTGFTACLLEKITADTDFDSWQTCEKRWTVSKLIRGIPSYELINEKLTELKALNNSTEQIIINPEIDLRNVLKNSSIRFKKAESSDDFNSLNNFNANIFRLIALVNDQLLVFKRDASELIQAVKLYNPGDTDNDIKALLQAVNNIPYQSFNPLLFT